MSRDWRIGIVGVAVLAELLLAYALFGHPPHALYSALKLTVAAATGAGAWALYLHSRRFLPISFGLVLIGGIHLFGRMRRSEWVTFNWAGVVGVMVVVVILTINLRRTNQAS
jgi:hypothetical protein